MISETPTIFNVKELAKYIINRCIEVNKPITNWELQGLLWTTQVNLTTSSICAFNEDFVVWQYINAIPIVYYDYNIGYGLTPIDELQVTNAIIPYKEIIDYIIDVYYVSTHKFDYSDLPLWTVIRDKYKINDRITTDIFISEINHYLQSEIYNYFQKGREYYKWYIPSEQAKDKVKGGINNGILQSYWKSSKEW